MDAKGYLVTEIVTEEVTDDEAASSSSLLSSLELSDATIYEPEIRALLGTTSLFCEAVVLKLRAVPPNTSGGADGNGRQGLPGHGNRNRGGDR